ncbi:MAG: glycerophosphodiester phosphodiesterase family protein [Verrucomicrobia bacterium]|nr:glycerophosphodiester phosphodiesterase family protein [Verrucomicrobiota bacterium]MDA1067505.1 glycerophosphodiester phosphodiesterase family protein [Verrucomicrobiota bacterium]
MPPLLVLYSLWAFAGSWSTLARDLEIVAHRGANHLAPENTYAAAQKCVQLGVDYVEVDVRTSSDGVMYIIHDKTLDRTTNGTGEVSARSSSYIDSLDAGSWFSTEFKGEKVPRLEPFLEAFKGKIKIYFDVKDADLAKLVELVRETGFERDCFFWFSNDQQALELRKLDPDIPLKMNAVDVDGLKRVLAYNPQIIEYRLENLTPEFVDFAQQNNLKLIAHALEDGAEKNYQAIIDSAADMVNLDMPDLMIEMLAKTNTDNPIRRTFKLGGVEREYFVRLPRTFDPRKTYWPLVSVHGGGGNGRNHFLSIAIREKADRLGLDAIVVSPSFSNSDFEASRFPVLGEDLFLKKVLKHLREDYLLRSKILLTGYSRGGQFSHRFAFAEPDLVEAVASFSAGTWTTPDGRLLIHTYGEVKDPKVFLSHTGNASLAPESFKNMFSLRVANVAGNPPKPAASKIPFLVMCGSLDERFEISKAFALSLIDAGFEVEAGWPRTAHGGRDKEEVKAEFEKYSSRALEFFKRVTAEE